VLVLIYAASVVLSVAYRYAVFPVGGENPAWISNQLPGTIDQFMIGTVLATGWRWWRADHEPGPGVARLSTALAAGGFMGIIAMIYYLDSIYDVFWSGKHPAVYVWYSVHAAFVGMLVLGVAMGGPLTRAVFANRVALLLGTISYSLYLWHFPVILWVEKIGKMGYATFFLVSIVACLAVSAISYLLLERPFLKMSRRSARAAP
jgi:peptidoglycan/LPS O-acetylase OafA/YrhL